MNLLAWLLLMSCGAPPTPAQRCEAARQVRLDQMPADRLVAACADLVGPPACRAALDGLPVSDAAQGVAIAQTCLDAYCAAGPSSELCGRALTTADVDAGFGDFVDGALLSEGVSQADARTLGSALPRALLPATSFRLDVRVEGDVLVVAVGPWEGPTGATARVSVAAPPASPFDTLDEAQIAPVLAWLGQQESDPVLVALLLYDEGVPEPERMRLARTLSNAGYGSLVACRLGRCD